MSGRWSGVGAGVESRWPLLFAHGVRPSPPDVVGESNSGEVIATDHVGPELGLAEPHAAVHPADEGGIHDRGVMGEVTLPPTIEERAVLVPSAGHAEPTQELEANSLEDAVAVERLAVGERALRREPVLVGDRLDPLSEVAVDELRPLDSQVDIVQPQLHVGDRGSEEVQRAVASGAVFSVGDSGHTAGEARRWPGIADWSIWRSFSSPPPGPTHGTHGMQHAAAEARMHAHGWAEDALKGEEAWASFA